MVLLHIWKETNMDRPNPFPKEYTEKELTEFLNTLSIPQSYAVIEKLYKG